MKQTVQTHTAICAACALLCAGLPMMPVSATVDPTEMTAVISLNGDSATVTGSNVTIDGTHITVTASGSYAFSGTLTDGMIEVAVPDETVDAETVKLFFDGVSVTGTTEAAVLITNAENTSINLVAGTENFLFDGPVYTNTNAAIYAKDDLSIKGEGALTITTNTQYGIHCNNDLKISGGTLRVDAELEDAIRGKTSVEIKGGNLNINAKGDGIKSTKGDVLISGGDIEVKAGNDAIQGETGLQIIGGTLLANGDRSFTCATASTIINGGTILATACELQPASLVATQPVMMLNCAEEWAKDQVVTVSANDSVCLSMKPDKKFSYALLSSPSFAVGTSYTVSIGTSMLKQAASDSTAFLLSDLQTTFESVTASAAAVLLGDVNLDNVRTMEDAVLMTLYLTERTKVVVESEGCLRMDCNQDGLVTMEDVLYVLQALQTVVS